MKVFISWSGERSRLRAEIVKTWIKRVNQKTDPWVSSDMTKGKRWTPQIANKLEESKVGIFVLTKDNLQSEWLHFEAGAISKTGDSMACTLLFDNLSPADITGPLSTFQHTLFTEGDMFKMMKDINVKLGDEKLEIEDLTEIYKQFYIKLVSDIGQLADSDITSVESKPRDPDQKLDEIVELIRNVSVQTYNMPYHSAMSIFFSGDIVDEMVGKFIVELRNRNYVLNSISEPLRGHSDDGKDPFFIQITSFPSLSSYDIYQAAGEVGLVVQNFSFI